jgi:predicted S18 family serine protease
LIWSNFFQLGGERLQLDEVHLRAACEAKLGEVEERNGYLSVLFEGFVLPVDRTELDAAYAMYDQGDYALCLFKASKAKAQIDVILSSVALESDELPALIDEKLAVARTVIDRELGAHRFPIMGYSYYEYAGALRDDDPYLASLFSSYALELGDLSLYFSRAPAPWEFVKGVLQHPFSAGFVLGVLAMVLVVVVNTPDHKKRRRRKV